MEFAHHQAASAAITAMNKRLCMGKEMKVLWQKTMSYCPSVAWLFRWIGPPRLEEHLSKTQVFTTTSLLETSVLRSTLRLWGMHLPPLERSQTAEWWGIIVDFLNVNSHNWSKGEGPCHEQVKRLRLCQFRRKSLRSNKYRADERTVAREQVITKAYGFGRTSYKMQHMCVLNTVLNV